jgi:glycosyltransferase involved in cell wall biosynthesis
VRETLARRSLQRAVHFDWKKAARQTAELYRRALG